MPAERLLKRIRHWGRGHPERVSQLDIGEYKKSVLDDLSLLYNTKRGTALIASELGVPDFASLMNSFGPDEIVTIEQAFSLLTQNYEPRMSNVIVKHRPRENEFGVLRFSVSGNLSFQNQELIIDFHALIQSSGAVVLDA